MDLKLPIRFSSPLKLLITYNEFNFYNNMNNNKTMYIQRLKQDKTTSSIDFATMDIMTLCRLHFPILYSLREVTRLINLVVFSFFLLSFFVFFLEARNPD